MPTLQEQAKSVFDQALEIDVQTDRHKFLENRFNDQPDLREPVESLLNAFQKAGSFLDAPPVALAETESETESAEPAVSQIGPYKLLHLLGEGGMGSVYLAEQQEPVKRRVAVKIIKQGMNSQQFVARFDAERQALAMMDHPNIAKVLGAGCTDDGRPYFVMELVKGVTITEFCDRNRLTTNERLKLFVEVCNAVQHAHQKGIIHRDLKPSNVMVAMYDDRAVPKVIDFGVAKATHQPLTEHTLYTVPGQIVGTWEYMSPEQAILNQLDVDTRTDIYSLGVILYQLLTGKTPLDLQSLQPGELEERLRRIREQEPARPSLRVSNLGQAAEPIAAYQKTQPARLAQSMRGDLDWIVLKALEKERTGRYETANGFAAEVKRYLSDEPISFRPPSRSERTKRFCRRNKLLVFATISVTFTLLVGISFATWGFASQQRAFKMLQTQLINQGLRLTFTNEKEQFDKTLEMADLAGLSEDWTLTLKGAHALHHGDNPNAIKVLKAALQQDPYNVSAKAMLSIALYHEGYVLEWMILTTDIDDWTPRDEYTEFDKLFIAYARIYGDYDQSIVELDEVLETHPTWFLPQLLLAIAYGESAQDSGNLDYISKSLRIANDSLDKSPDNPFVLAVAQFVHEVALRQLKTPPDSTKKKASEIVVRLEEFKDYDVAMMLVASYHDIVKDRDHALRIWEHLLLDSRSFLRSRAMAEFFREGRGQEILTITVDANDPQARIAQAYMLALTPGRQEEARTICEQEIRRAKTTLTRYHLLPLLLLLGQTTDASTLCHEWMKDQSVGGRLHSDDVYRRIFAYIAGEPTSAEFKSPYELFQLNYIKALVAYSKKEDVEAQRLLKLCNESQGQSTEHHWARAFLARWSKTQRNVKSQAGAAQ